MKASRILFGIGVGVAAGFVVALQGRDETTKVSRTTRSIVLPLLVQNQNYNVNLKRLNKVLMTF